MTGLRPALDLHPLMPGPGRGRQVGQAALGPTGPAAPTGDEVVIGMARTAARSVGVVYLLHFDAPYVHARHYTGWTTDLPDRLAAHQRGTGARLLAVITAHGIGFTLARTWTGTRSRERQLKRQGGASRRCPLCGVAPRSPPGDSGQAGNSVAVERAQ